MFSCPICVAALFVVFPFDLVHSFKVIVSAKHNFLVSHAIWLNCSATSLKEGEAVKEIAWYKDKDKLFYRYSPGSDEEEDSALAEKKVTLLFDKGVTNVNLNRSNEGNVLIERTNLNTSGCFKCEIVVSAEPDGKKVEEIKEKATIKIKAIYLPESLAGPQLVHDSGLDEPISFGIYNAGQLFKASCTSQRSNPAAKLDFLINGKKVPQEKLMSDKLLEFQHTVQADDGIYQYKLFESQRNVSLLIRPQLVDHRKMMRVTCVATVSGSHGFSDVQTSEELRVLVLSHREKIFESGQVFKEKLVFYGFVAILVGLLLIWYLCTCGKTDEQKETQDDNVSNKSAYDIHYRRASLAFIAEHEPVIQGLRTIEIPKNLVADGSQLAANNNLSRDTNSVAIYVLGEEKTEI